MKRIAAFPMLHQAELAVQLLRAHGHTAMDVPTASHVSLAGADQWYFVWVPENGSPAAQSFLTARGYAANLLR